jgi:hypothetical protein
VTDTAKDLREFAREKLARLSIGGSLEWLWAQFALESLSAGRIVEPETSDVRRLTAPDRIWSGVAPWPREEGWYRIAAVSRAHRLAIIRDDREWLAELGRCWDALPLNAFASQLRALGEIGLGLAPEGPRPFGWTDDEVAVLIDNEVIRDDVGPDLTWIALARGNLVAARHALTDYEALIAAFHEKWRLAPEPGVREGLAQPDLVLQIESRALRTLIQRAEGP